MHVDSWPCSSWASWHCKTTRVVVIFMPLRRCITSFIVSKPWILQCTKEMSCYTVQVILFKELLVSSNALVFIRLCLLCLLWLLQFFRVHILVEVEQSISPLARSSCCKGIHNEMWDPPFDIVLEQNGHSSGVGILGIGSNNGAG